MSDDTPAQSKGSFGSNVLLSFGFTGLFTIFALGNSIVVAQMAGTTGRGLYALAVAVLGISIPIASGGLHYAATWAVGQGRTGGEVSTLGHLWPLLLTVLVSLGIGAGCAVAGGIPEAGWARVAIASAATLPAAVYVENVRGLLLGRNRIVPYHLIQAASGGSILALNFWLLHFGPAYVLLSLALAYWVPGIVILAMHLPHLRAARRPSGELVRASFRYGAGATATLLAEICLLRLDFLLVAPFITVHAIGLYSTADQISHLLAWGGLIAGRMMLAQSASDPDGERSRAKLGLAIRVLLVCVTVAAVGAAATGWFVIPLVFGAEFGPAYAGLLVLLPTACLKGVYSLMSTWMIGRDQARPVIVAGVAALALDVALCIPAAMLFGWLAVAAARAVALFVQLAFTYRAYLRIAGEPMRWLLNGEDVQALKNWRAARRGRRGSGAAPAEADRPNRS